MDKITDIISNKIVEYLICNNDIDTRKKDIYIYGTIVVIQSFINFFCSIIIGLLLNMFFENLCFFFVFRILRKFSGGYHSNKYSTCLLSSLIINIAILILLKTIYYNPNLWINLIVYFISFLIIIFFVPITNENKPISNKEHKVYKFFSCSICLMFFAVSLILTFYSNTYGNIISLSVGLNSILVLLEEIKRKLAR